MIVLPINIPSLSLTHPVQPQRLLTYVEMAIMPIYMVLYKKYKIAVCTVATVMDFTRSYIFLKQEYNLQHLDKFF